MWVITETGDLANLNIATDIVLHKNCIKKRWEIIAWWPVADRREKAGQTFTVIAVGDRWEMAEKLERIKEQLSAVPL